MNDKPSWEYIVSRISGASFALGQVGGLKDSVGKLREWSGVCYAEGKDKEAQVFREAANALEESMKAKRAFYDKHHKPELDEMWGLLEKEWGKLDD